MVWLNFENSFVQPFGLLQLTCLMVFDGIRECLFGVEFFNLLLTSDRRFASPVALLGGSRLFALHWSNRNLA